MNAFKKKALATALVGVSALSLAGTVQAVELSTIGQGQALIYPYYTVQKGEDGSGYDTLLSVVNYTDDAKAVRVNIREGKQGMMALDFNIFLAPNDTWTAALVADGDGAKIITQDQSCTLPVINREVGQSLLGYGIEGVELNRLREGYIEMIEMGTIPAGTPTFERIRNINGATSCDIHGGMVIRDVTGPNTGGLVGQITMINVQSGFAFSNQATALDRFAKAGEALGYGREANGNWKTVDLTAAAPISTVLGQGEDLLLISEWEGGTADAVSAVLMHQKAFNQFYLSESTASKTNWVLTFPTKYSYVIEKSNPTKYTAPFGEVSDILYMNYVDRRGLPLSNSGCFTGLCPGPSNGKAKFASNVFFFSAEEKPKKSDILFPTPNMIDVYWWGNSLSNSGSWLGYYRSRDGHASIEWDESVYYGNSVRKETHLLKNDKTMVIKKDGTVLKDQVKTYYGLPVVGFSAYTYTNAGIELSDGKVGRSIYGVTEPHSYKNKIE